MRKIINNDYENFDIIEKVEIKQEKKDIKEENSYSDSEEEIIRKNIKLDQVKMDNRINIYLGSKYAKLFKIPVEKIDIYKGKLVSRYVLKEHLKKEKNSVFVDKESVSPAKKPLPIISLQTITPKRTRNFSTLDLRYSESVKPIYSTERKFTFKTSISPCKKVKKENVINYMNKKDFYY